MSPTRYSATATIRGFQDELARHFRRMAARRSIITAKHCGSGTTGLETTDDGRLWDGTGTLPWWNNYALYPS